MRPPQPSRLTETEPFEAVVECILAWPLDSPEFATALAQSTRADRDETIRRLQAVKDEHQDRQFRLRWQRAELENDHPGIDDAA